MSRRRHLFRFTARSTVRRVARVTSRVRWRAPDDLGAALAAFRRAIRAHRRLARLAPRFFDSVVVERERRDREAQRRWMAEWEPVLARVYGSEPQPPPDPGKDLPPLPSPRTIQAVERELASWNLWCELGRTALERHRHRHPHALVNFSRLARLLELGFDLARLACGSDSHLPDSEPDIYEQAMADLNRAYGHRCDPAPASPPSPSVPAVPEPSVPAACPGGRNPASPIPSPPPADIAAPTCTGSARRDVWSSWARQMRRQALARAP